MIVDGDVEGDLVDEVGRHDRGLGLAQRLADGRLEELLQRGRFEADDLKFVLINYYDLLDLL